MIDFFEVIKARRSIRKYKPEPFSEELVKKALEAAVLAPNSSNVQTWDFYWIKRNSSVKSKVVEACLNQSAARTADQLLVAVADPKNWRRSQSGLINWVKNSKAPKSVLYYYEKLIPFTYSSGILNILAPIKLLIMFFVGLFRPMTRKPVTSRDIQEVAIKSAALACENFVLAIAAQGGATCMMEGFDEWRLKRILKLPRSSRVVMVISIGIAAENGTWGEQYRLPNEMVIHEVK